MFEQLGLRMVFRITVGHPGEVSLTIEMEMLSLTDGFLERIGIEKNLVADASEHDVIRTIHARAKHIMPQIAGPFGFDMEVIAAFHRFLAIGTYEDAEMGLVRPLIG